LLAFSRKTAEFDQLNIQLMAASSDLLEDARKTVERYRLPFTVGYGLDARDIAAKTGAFYAEKEGFLHATGFLVNPDGKVVNAVYSTSAIGRLVPEDCVGLIRHFQQG